MTDRQALLSAAGKQRPYKAVNIKPPAMPGDIYLRVFCLFPRQEDDGGQDAQGTEEVEGGEGDVEQGDGEEDGGEGFGGAEDARLGRLEVLEAAEVAGEGDDGAEEDDVGKE